MSLPGYEIPIHRSLTEQILRAGAPRTFTIMNGTLAAALGFGLHSVFALPLCLIMQLAAVAANQTDPQFYDCFMRHIKQKNFYTV